MPIIGKLKSRISTRQLSVGTVNIFYHPDSDLGRVYVQDDHNDTWTERWFVFQQADFVEMRAIKLRPSAEPWSAAALSAMRAASSASVQAGKGAYRYAKMQFTYKSFPSQAEINQLPNWVDTGVAVLERRLVIGGVTRGWLHRQVDADKNGATDYWVFTTDYWPPNEADANAVDCGNYSASYRNPRDFMNGKNSERAGAEGWTWTSIKYRFGPLPTTVEG